jgi:hypothetical protein
MITVANGCVVEFKELDVVETACRARYNSERWTDRSGASIFYVQMNCHHASHSWHPDKQSTSANGVFPFN